MKDLAKASTLDQLKQLMSQLKEKYDRAGKLEKIKMLQWPEYTFLKKHPLVTIAHHSHTHHCLNKLPLNDLSKDIDACIQVLGAPEYFAYPFGFKNKHFDENVKELIKQKQYKCAFSVEDQPRYDHLDIFEIPRKEMRMGDHLKIEINAGAKS